MNTANSFLKTKNSFDYIEIISQMLSDIQNELIDNSENDSSFISLIIALLSHQLSFINQLRQMLSNLSDDIIYKQTFIDNLISINKEITMKKINHLCTFVVSNNTSEIKLSNNDVIDKIKNKFYIMIRPKKELISIHVSDSPINKSISEISFDMEKQIVKSSSMFCLNNKYSRKKSKNTKSQSSLISTFESTFHLDKKRRSAQISSRNSKRERDNIFNKSMENRKYSKNGITMINKKSENLFYNKIDNCVNQEYYQNLKNIKSRYHLIPIQQKINKTPVSKMNLNRFINVIVNSFLLISFYIMIAGFSAYMEQAYKIPIYFSKSY